MDKRNQRGFTLIEAAVAIAVVAILSGIVVPLVIKNISDSQVARAKNDLQVIAAAIASQIKDTGGRPSKAAGPGASDGSGQAIWGSGGTEPTCATQALVTGTVPANTFVNLFTTTDISGTAPGSTLFSTTFGNEFSYRGPYLAADVAAKSDPWGSKYKIFGYNATGQSQGGPIWVVCAGPDKAILLANVTVSVAAPVGIYVPIWDTTTGASADDIAVRVN
jgi:prepilin-type N-terminal cleavage/methylation domain-containing protein